MSNFDESKVNRARDGKFDFKRAGEPAVGLSETNGEIGQLEKDLLDPSLRKKAMENLSYNHNEYALRHPDPEVRMEAFEWCDEEGEKLLQKDPDVNVRRYIAEYTNSPQSMINDEDDGVREQAFVNYFFQTDSVDEYLDTKDIAARRAVFRYVQWRHKDDYSEVIDELIRNGGIDGLESLSHDPHYANMLVSHPDKKVRRIALIHASNPSDFLESLGKEDLETVAWFNNNLTSEDAMKLAKHHDSDIRSAIARNSILSDSQRRELLRHEINGMVTYDLAKELPDEDKEHFATADNYRLRWAATNTDNENILRRLASDKEFIVRYSVAKRTKDRELLRKLAKDEDPHVRFAVVNHSTDFSLLRELIDSEDEEISRRARERLIHG
ncbi:HEAT repeat domain-containing protein [Actinomyces vulturis]|uniref:HEAT repeat domain-containing protein n=1 Tax=Actinomyces vulturis TaxID=1857645 RepID=UPI000830AD79|nr:HEAT repeat domain-containing protein [Actinomyces vulturis]